MTALRRRAARSLPSILAIGLGLFAVGCGSTATSSAQSSTAPMTATASASVLTPVPDGASSAPATLPPTTDTEFGKIFDALPPSFPKLPGQEESEGGSATSGQFVVNGEPAALGSTLKAALGAQGWTADVGSPLEDGTVVLEASRPPAGCKLEVRFTPTSGTVMMSVLYGAACTFS